MHIGMRLLHPAAADHSVSINRQQVQRIFSFSLRSRAVFIVLLQTYLLKVPQDSVLVDGDLDAGTRSVGVELLEYIQEQDGGTTETVSEAPGAYGGCGGGHAAGAAPYETASTLAPWPSPEVGVAERHAEGPSHSSLPPNLHPVVRPFIPSGRSAPGTGLQARCGLHRRLRQGLGGHVQRACSVGGLDEVPNCTGTSTA